MQWYVIFLAFQQQGELACAWRDAATAVFIFYFFKEKKKT